MYALLIKSQSSGCTDLLGILSSAGFESCVVNSLEDFGGSSCPGTVRLICLDSSLGAELQNKMCAQIRDITSLQMLPITVLIDSEGVDNSIKKHALRCGATEILLRADLEALKRSFFEYAQRFRHDRYSGRVLVVEDDKALSELIRISLESRGLEVDVFSSAEEAIIQYQEAIYDLVVTDVMLEGEMTGLSLLRWIRSNIKSETRMPVLVMTAFDNPARKIEILYSGADDYLAKPIEPLELITRAGNLLRAKFMCDAIREQKEELRNMSVTDVLTGLYNKRFLYESGSSMLSDATRYGEALSLLVIDIDKFKPINDKYGHDVGDEVLAEIGKTIKLMTRSGDVAARFGGDEFVVMLSHSDTAIAQNKADELCKAIHKLKPCGMVVSASIGITEYRKDSDLDFYSLFREADRAVYQAKECGGNQVCIYSLG